MISRQPYSFASAAYSPTTLCGSNGGCLPRTASATKRSPNRMLDRALGLAQNTRNRVQRRLIHLSLSWADAVSHDCTAHAQRFLHSLSRISRSLVLHLGVELGSDQDHDDRKPDPDHEADSGT